MPRFGVRVLPLLTGMTLLFQIPQVLAASDEPGPNAPVAVIGNEHITFSQLPDAQKDLAIGREHYEQQLHQLEIDYQRARQTAIEQYADIFIDDEIMQKEAQSRHVTVEQLIKEVKNPVVTDEDVRAFYEKSKPDIDRPFDQAKPAILQFLQQQALEDGKRNYLTALRAKYSARRTVEPLREQVAADGPARGPNDARVTIVEFADFQCPYCRRMFPVLKQVLEKHPTDVRLVFRQLPLTDLHPNAMGAAQASLCAHEQGKFWEMHDAMFTAQDGLNLENLKKIADKLRLPAQPFADCLASDRTKAPIEADKDAAAQYGVNATPGIFVNGRFFNGAISYGVMEATIEDELARTSGHSSRLASQASRE
jgi:protein-disulfide isomerase